MIEGNGSTASPFVVDGNQLGARWAKSVGDEKADRLFREILVAYANARFALSEARECTDLVFRKMLVASALRWRKRIRAHREQLRKRRREIFARRDELSAKFESFGLGDRPSSPSAETIREIARLDAIVARWRSM